MGAKRRANAPAWWIKVLDLKCAFVLQIVFRTYDTSNFGVLAVCTSALSDWLARKNN